MSAVTIVMGSKSDLASLQGAFDTLRQFGVPFRARILSAHRTPDEAAALAKTPPPTARRSLSAPPAWQPIWPA